MPEQFENKWYPVVSYAITIYYNFCSLVEKGTLLVLFIISFSFHFFYMIFVYIF